MDMFDHRGTLDRLNRMTKNDLLKLAETLKLRAYVSTDKRFMDFIWVNGKDGKPKARRSKPTDVVHNISTYFRDGKGDYNYWVYVSFPYHPLVTYGSEMTHRKIKLENVGTEALASAILDALETAYLGGWFGEFDPLDYIMYLAGVNGMDTAAEKLLRTLLYDEYGIADPSNGLLDKLANEIKAILGINVASTLTEEDIRNMTNVEFEMAADWAVEWCYS